MQTVYIPLSHSPVCVNDQCFGCLLLHLLILAPTLSKSDIIALWVQTFSSRAVAQSLAQEILYDAFFLLLFKNREGYQHLLHMGHSKNFSILGWGNSKHWIYLKRVVIDLTNLINYNYFPCVAEQIIYFPLWTQLDHFFFNI